jgi:lipoprotein-releasing system ATP-binding protein
MGTSAYNGDMSDLPMPRSSPGQLVVDNVTKEFLTRAEPLRVLNGVSFELSSGNSLAIVGPSGCGKSTLLHLIGTLDRPTSGSITLDRQDPFQLAEPQLADFRNRQIGFVFQDHHLLPQCTVLENVLIGATAAGQASKEIVERGRELVQRVGLADRVDHRPAELSGGERQRVALSRALLMRPVLLLADEPTGNLDRTTADGIANLLVELQLSEQTMLVVVTHSALLAARMQQQYELEAGKLNLVAS